MDEKLEPRACTCRAEGQLHPGLCQKQWEQQGQGSDSAPQLCPSALPLCDLTCSAVSRPGVFSTRAGPEEGYENDWGLEYLSYKDGWRELELFSMEKRRVCVILIVVLQYHKWGYKKDISFYMDR
ncbi:hypothetical protein HGM15179_000762 [Zosterops borbonicus]|uniref:Uncharacterized protein n=1 Tax=Zosterops borbonicus TaxID=364589 RepID=A0A8K1GYE4_9PASS|nr:hypothetical protein HGM15179_000762 [Zosterops borbonicus]